MKDPSSKHFTSEYGITCVEDGKSWPCKTWRRWLKSPDRRLKVLEDRADTQARENLRQNKELRELQEEVRRAGITIKGVLMPFIDDLAKGVTDGRATFSETIDYQDHTGLFDRPIMRTAARREWTAKYESPSGTWVNGNCTERTLRKP